MDEMQTDTDVFKKWERAEIARSETEAQHANDLELHMSDKTIARYKEAAADTSYPLEYSYHLLGDVSDKSVLDFGCGSGENSVLLAHRGANVIAMDISESLIHVAERRLAVNRLKGPIRFLACSAHDIALADESVDVVFGMAILHHLELPLVAKEVRRVLRKGGRAIFKEPVRNSRFMGFVRGLIPYKSQDVSPFERPLTDGQLKDFAEGYSGFRSRAFTLPFINLAELLPGTGRVINSLYRFDGAILKRLPALGHFATVRVFEVVK